MSKLTGQKRSRWIAVIVVLSVAGGITALVTREPGVKTARLVVAAADKGEVTVDVATIGTVEPASTRALSFMVDGTVASVAVQAGNRVAAKQTLATLDGADTAEDLAEARAKLADARNRLAAASGNAAATTREATACARGVKESRTGTCPTRGYPDGGVDQVLSAEQAVNNAEKGVEDAEDAVAGTVIKAPIAGTVVAVSAGVGDRVRAGSTVLSLADTYTMQVRAEFPEADAGALAVGQDATVTLAGSDYPIAARVAQVDPAGASDGTLVRYGVLLSFADSPENALVGQSAQVIVRTGHADAAVRVPSTAVHDVAGDSGLVLVRAGNRSVQRAVGVGLRGDRYTEITDGLAEGEQVVRSW